MIKFRIYQENMHCADPRSVVCGFQPDGEQEQADSHHLVALSASPQEGTRLQRLLRGNTEH